MHLTAPQGSLKVRIDLLVQELMLAIEWNSPCILLAAYRSEIIRERVESTLRTTIQRQGQAVREIRLNKQEYDLPLLVRADPSTATTVFFVSGLQWAGGRGYSNAYRALNMHREYLVEDRIKSIFWLTLSEFQKLPRRAPDFWAFRHKAVDFSDLPSWQDLHPTGEPGKDQGEMLKKYHQQLEKNPSDPSTHQKLARMYHAIGCYEDAVFHYKKAIRLDPGRRSVRAALSDLYWDLGQNELSSRIRQKITRKEPAHPDDKRKTSPGSQAGLAH